MKSIGFGGEKTAKSKHRKTSDFSDLTTLQARYLVCRANRAKHKSKRSAALAAGYSKATADNAAQLIETPRVREAWQAILQSEFEERELISVLREGLSATKPIAASFKGTITDVVLCPDHTERRKNAELIMLASGRYERNETKQPTVMVPIQIVTSIPRPQRG